jgi:dihydrofolate reductase
MDERGGIGKNNRLPWHLPSDLTRFKHITMGHHLVMGRKTYQTIGGPLPGRQMIVVTHQKGYFPKDCLVVNSIEGAIRVADDKHESEIFIIGGGEVFKQAISLADKIYLTTVHTFVDADVSFPNINPGDWELFASEGPLKTEKDEYESDFKILIRKH